MKKITLILVGLVFCFSLFADNNLTVSGSSRTRFAMYNSTNGMDGQGIGEKMSTSSVIDSRLRLMFENAFDENLKANFKIEIGNVLWGDDGGELNTRDVNVESMQLYVDFHHTGQDFDLKVGLLPWEEHSLLVLGADMAGLFVDKDFGDLNVEVGTAKMHENDLAGDDDEDLFFVNFDYNSFGMDNIIQRCNAGNDISAWIMPYYVHKMDDFTFDITGIYNYGSYTDAELIDPDTEEEYVADATNGGFGVDFKAMYEKDFNVGLEFLYTSGDDGKDPESTTIFNTIADDYSNGLEIFGVGLYDSVQLGGTGVTYGDEDCANGSMNIILTGSYPVRDNFTVRGAAGMLNAVEGDETAVGTEFDLGFTWKLHKAFSFDMVGAMAMPGKYYGEDLDNLFEITSVFKYDF